MLDPFVVALSAVLDTAPKPQPKHTLENIILVEQLADDFETWHFLHKPGYYEQDPFAKPFVHSPITMIGTTLLTNAALRALPEGKTKTLLLKLVVSGEGANVLVNLRTF